MTKYLYKQLTLLVGWSVWLVGHQVRHLFLVACTLLYNLLYLSVTLLFLHLWVVFALKLLPKYFVSLLCHCPFPPTHDLCSRESSLIFFKKYNQSIWMLHIAKDLSIISPYLHNIEKQKFQKWVFHYLSSQRNPRNHQNFIYRRDHFKSWGGTLSLSTPTTAHCFQTILTLTVAVDTLGGYKWRHHSDFWIST